MNSADHSRQDKDGSPYEGEPVLPRLHLVRAPDPAGDEAHLERVARRAPGALDALYYATSARLYAVALRMVGNAEDAQEVLQDAYVRIWNKAESYDAHQSRAFTWMVMLLRGLCLDKLRKRNVRPVDSAAYTPKACGDLSALVSPGDTFLRVDTLDGLRSAFSVLDEEDQELLQQILFTPATLVELAEAAGQPVGTLKSRVHRAMSKLRTLIRWDHETA
jgi:RNA polymerase sigma-70 factor, ECF subfamily